MISIQENLNGSMYSQWSERINPTVHVNEKGVDYQHILWSSTQRKVYHRTEWLHFLLQTKRKLKLRRCCHRYVRLEGTDDETDNVTNKLLFFVSLPLRPHFRVRLRGWRHDWKKHKLQSISRIGYYIPGYRNCRVCICSDDIAHLMLHTAMQNF